MNDIPNDISSKKINKTPKLLPNGKFAKGNASGGRTKGSSNPVTRMVNAFIEGELPNAIEVIKQAIKDGDVKTALDFYKHSVPSCKTRSIGLPITSIKTMDDVAMAMDAVVIGMTSGTISLDEAKTISDIFEIRRKAIETQDILVRLKAVESLYDGNVINHTPINQKLTTD